MGSATKFRSVDLKGGDHLKDRSIDGRVILKSIVKK
jgi:hypothetical protein